MNVCTSAFEFSTLFAHEMYAHTLFSVNLRQLQMNVYWRSVFFAHKNKSQRNLNLVRKASESSNSKGSNAKIERRRRLACAGNGRRETKLYAAGSRVSGFLMTVAPWEFYFTDILSVERYGQPTLVDSPK